MNPRIIVTDNFLKKPTDILKLCENKSHWKPTLRGDEFQLARSTAKNLTKQLITTTGLKFDFNSSSYTGVIRKTSVKKMNSRYAFKAHFDYGWNSVVYLNQNHSRIGGTGFFVHNRTGLDGLTNIEVIDKAIDKLKWTLDDLVDCLLVDEFNPKKWSETMRVNSKFNRSILFDGLLFHSHLVEPNTNIPRLTLNNYYANPTDDLEWFTAAKYIYNTKFFVKLRNFDSSEKFE